MVRLRLSRLRPRHYCLAVLILVVALLLSRIIPVYQRSYSESPRVRERYIEMWTSLQSGDFEGARALIAPQYRNKSMHKSFIPFKGFVKPLSTNSLIRVKGDRAIVFPEHRSRLKMLNLRIPFWFDDSGQGNYLELIEVDGKWYFTGNLHVD